MSSNQSNSFSDQLLAVLCHDISNPLTVLAFNLEILSNSEYSDIELNQQRFNRCLSAVKKMRSILELVKDAHLLQLGKLKIAANPISLKNCWEQVVVDFDTGLKLKNIKIIQTEWPENDRVLGNEQILISHVFSNLLSNAIKFSLPSGTIWIGAQKINEFEISFYISDEGMGIPENKIRDLFELKKQTTSSGSAHERGSGLGLPIVQFFLSHLNAKIEVRSRFNSNNEIFHGTLFEIRFKKVS